MHRCVDSTQKSETGKSHFVNSREDVDIWVNEIQAAQRKKAKKMSLPFPVYSTDAIRWALEFLTHPSQYELNMDDDYTRVLVRTSRRVREEQNLLPPRREMFHSSECRRDNRPPPTHIGDLKPEPGR